MWQECLRDFFGLQFWIQGFSWEGKFGKYFIRGLDLSRVFWGCSFNNLNILDSARISWPRSSANKVQPSKVQGVGVNYSRASWKFLRLRNSPCDFFVVNFWSRDFLGSVGSPRDFLGFEFCPHSIIPVTWNPEYPLGLYCFCLFLSFTLPKSVNWIIGDYQKIMNKVGQ